MKDNSLLSVFHSLDGWVHCAFVGVSPTCSGVELVMLRRCSLSRRYIIVILWDLVCCGQFLLLDSCVDHRDLFVFGFNWWWIIKIIATKHLFDICQGPHNCLYQLFDMEKFLAALHSHKMNTLVLCSS